MMKPGFDRAAAGRRGMLAKIHLAKAELGMVEDDYRAVLLRCAGKASAAELTMAEMEAVLADFVRRGWQAKPRAGKGATHPTALKARALWVSLYHLGAVHNASEQALEAFAKRQLGCERLAWANQGLAYKLIEALKAIAERHGWDQSIEGVAPAAVPIVLRRRLVERLVALLVADGLVPSGWSINDAAHRLGGIELTSDYLFWRASELDQVAAALGAVRRDPRAKVRA